MSKFKEQLNIIEEALLKPASAEESQRRNKTNPLMRSILETVVKLYDSGMCKNVNSYCETVVKKWYAPVAKIGLQESDAYCSVLTKLAEAIDATDYVFIPISSSYGVGLSNIGHVTSLHNALYEIIPNSKWVAYNTSESSTKILDIEPEVGTQVKRLIINDNIMMKNPAAFELDPYIQFDIGAYPTSNIVATIFFIREDVIENIREFLKS